MLKTLYIYFYAYNKKTKCMNNTEKYRYYLELYKNNKKSAISNFSRSYHQVTFE